MPALQLAQLDAPASGWNAPEAHSVHEVAFWPSENEPPMHLPQALDGSLKKPGSQFTGLHADEPTTDVSKPLAQAAQAEAPADA